MRTQINPRLSKKRNISLEYHIMRSVAISFSSNPTFLHWFLDVALFKKLQNAPGELLLGFPIAVRPY